MRRTEVKPPVNAANWHQELTVGENPASKHKPVKSKKKTRLIQVAAASIPIQAGQRRKIAPW